jgi:hypothetical protein
VNVKSFIRCDSCEEFIEDSGQQLSEPFDHQADGSYRVTVLNPELPCKICGGLLNKPVRNV